MIKKGAIMVNIGVLLTGGIFFVALASFVVLSISVVFTWSNARFNKLEKGQANLEKRMDRLEAGQAKILALLEKKQV